MLKAGQIFHVALRCLGCFSAHALRERSESKIAANRRNLDSGEGDMGYEGWDKGC